jgi:hypothetical protein
VINAGFPHFLLARKVRNHGVDQPGRRAVTGLTDFVHAFTSA